MTGGTGFSLARIEQYVGTGRPVNHYRRRGTGLQAPGLINGREGTEDEIAARDRAWQRERDAAAELLNIAPYQASVRAQQWAAVDNALRQVTRG